MFNAQGFIDDLYGGYRVVHEQHGWALDRVRKWYDRGSIPGEVLAEMLVHLEKTIGQPVSLRAYVKDPRCSAKATSPTKPVRTGQESDIFG